MIGLFPIVGASVLVVLVLIFVVLRKVRTRAVHGEQIKIWQLILFAVPLVLLYLLYCFYLLFKIGLLHSSPSLSAFFPLQAVLSFLVVVALPIGLLIAYCRARSRKVTVALTVIYGVILISSLIWCKPGMKASVVDQSGSPVKYIYVLYHYPRYFLFSHWALDAFTHTDEKGCFIIPPDVQFQFPFEYWVPFVKRVTWAIRSLVVYAPTLHNFSYIDDADSGLVREYPHRVDVRKKGFITLRDMTENPADRYDLLFRLAFRTYFTGLKGPREDMKELLAYMREEYRPFTALYGDTIRQPGTDNLGPWFPGR